MDTEKFKQGWAMALVSGMIPKETAKLKRILNARGFQKIQSGVYARSCVSILPQKFMQNPENHMNTLSGIVREAAKKTTETTVRLIWISRSQWERSCIFQGQSAPAQEAVI